MRRKSIGEHSGTPGGCIKVVKSRAKAIKVANYGVVRVWCVLVVWTNVVLSEGGNKKGGGTLGIMECKIPGRDRRRM